MNRFTKALSSFGTRLKAATSILFTNYTFPGFGWRTDWTKPWLSRQRGIDYSNVDAGSSSIVQACVLWIARTFPEAPVQVLDLDGGAIKPHPMVQLINRPNPFYSGLLLWMATLIDYSVTGNAYWLKVRSGAGRPVQLWYTPSWLIGPRWPQDGSAFISHYEYTPAGRPLRIESADVVHFRYGLDAQTRKGISPLASVLSEIFTDQEAAAFTGSLLKNLGIPGVVITPDGADADIDTEGAALIKAEFQENFSGDKRGTPMVLGGPTKVQLMGFSPEQMDLKVLRQVPEERVSAVLGVPAIVAGLGAGLSRSTYANYAEARESAFESGIIPTQRLLAAELQVQLLPDFVANPDTQEVVFDLSNVRVLQDDMDKLYARNTQAVLNGWITVAEARKKAGFEVGPEHDLYYVPNGVTVTPAAELGVMPEPEPQVGAGVEEPNDEGEPMPEPAPAKSRKSTKAATVSDADEAERIFEERLQLVGLEPAKAGTNGRH